MNGLTFHLFIYPKMEQELSAQERAVKIADELLPRLIDFKPEVLARLQTLLSRLDNIHAQEAVLSMVRIQEQEDSGAWQTGAGHKNFMINNSLWRQIRARGYELMKEFKEATVEAFGPLNEERDNSFSHPSLSPGLRADFAPVRQLCLIYPADVREPGDDYTPLANFYNRLLGLLPTDIDVVLLVKSRQVMAQLQSENFHQRIRYVVNTDLKGIWLRDYAGFNLGTHLVKPTYKPKYYWGDFAVAQSINENMRILHSLLELDMEQLDLVWDGGNLVSNGHYGFVSTRLLTDNAKKTQTQIEQLIRTSLGIEPIWVALPEADKLAHTDGYLTFISPNKALVSTYPETWARKYPDDQRCVDGLARQLQDLGIEVVRIQEQPQDVAESSPTGNAVGLYVNLLQLNSHWLVPTYGLEGEQEILAQFERLNPDGTIIPIDCTELARLGGVLHCISFCN